MCIQSTSFANRNVFGRRTDAEHAAHEAYDEARKAIMRASAEALVDSKTNDYIKEKFDHLLDPSHELTVEQADILMEAIERLSY